MEPRKQEEVQLHNTLRDAKLQASKEHEYLHANKKWYAIVRASVNVSENWLRKECPGKKALDYCCGNGELAFKIASLGTKETVGIDISDVSVSNCARQAEKLPYGKKMRFQVMDAENMTFDDNYFDVVHVSGVLHHLDLKKAYAEIARVLKPSGKCLCIEALGHNKIIQLYRQRTPQLRTEFEAEHILCRKDIKLAGNYFRKVKIVGFYHLATIAATPFRNSKIFKVMLPACEMIDSALLKLPLIKWQAWQVIFELSGPIKAGK